jgi:hypothetical protein
MTRMKGRCRVALIAGAWLVTAHVAGADEPHIKPPIHER